MARRNRSYMSLDPVTQQRTRVSVTSKSTNESIQEFVALAARRDLASRHKSLETKGGTDWPRLQELVDSLRGNEAFSPDVIERLQGFVDAEEATNEFRELVEAMVDEGGDGSDVAQDMLDALGTGIYGDKAAGSLKTKSDDEMEVRISVNRHEIDGEGLAELAESYGASEVEWSGEVFIATFDLADGVNAGRFAQEARDLNGVEALEVIDPTSTGYEENSTGSSLMTKGSTPIGFVGEALDVLESMDDGFGGFDHWIDALKEVYDSDLSDPDAITEAQAKIEKVRREVDGTEWVNAEEDETGPTAEWYLDKANQVISLLDEAIADLAANGVYDERSASGLKSKSNDELVQFLRSAADDAAEFAGADAEIGPGGGDGAMEQAAALVEAADHVADGNLDLALQALNDAPQDGSVMREAIERVETEIEGMASNSASGLETKGGDWWEKAKSQLSGIFDTATIQEYPDSFKALEEWFHEVDGDFGTPTVDDIDEFIASLRSWLNSCPEDLRDVVEEQVDDAVKVLSDAGMNNAEDGEERSVAGLETKSLQDLIDRLADICDRLGSLAENTQIAGDFQSAADSLREGDTAWFDNHDPGSDGDGMDMSGESEEVQELYEDYQEAFRAANDEYHETRRENEELSASGLETKSDQAWLVHVTVSGRRAAGDVEDLVNDYEPFTQHSPGGGLTTYHFDNAQDARDFAYACQQVKGVEEAEYVEPGDMNMDSANGAIKTKGDDDDEFPMLDLAEEFSQSSEGRAIFAAEAEVMDLWVEFRETPEGAEVAGSGNWGGDVLNELADGTGGGADWTMHISEADSVEDAIGSMNEIADSYSELAGLVDNAELASALKRLASAFNSGADALGNRNKSARGLETKDLDDMVYALRRNQRAPEIAEFLERVEDGDLMSADPEAVLDELHGLKELVEQVYGSDSEEYAAVVDAVESSEKSAGESIETKAGGKAHLESILDSLLKGAEDSLVDGDLEASANLDAIQETINALDQAGDAQDADELEQLAGVLREQFSVIGNGQSTDLDDLDQFIAAAKDE